MIIHWHSTGKTSSLRERETEREQGREREIDLPARGKLNSNSLMSIVS